MRIPRTPDAIARFTLSFMAFKNDRLVRLIEKPHSACVGDWGGFRLTRLARSPGGTEQISLAFLRPDTFVGLQKHAKPISAQRDVDGSSGSREDMQLRANLLLAS